MDAQILKVTKSQHSSHTSRFPIVPDSFSGFTTLPPQPDVGADDMSCLPAVGLIVFEVSAPYQRTTALFATSPLLRNPSMFPSYPDAENNLFSRYSISAPTDHQHHMSREFRYSCLGIGRSYHPVIVVVTSQCRRRYGFFSLRIS